MVKKTSTAQHTNLSQNKQFTLGAIAAAVIIIGLIFYVPYAMKTNPFMSWEQSNQNTKILSEAAQTGDATVCENLKGGIKSGTEVVAAPNYTDGSQANTGSSPGYTADEAHARCVELASTYSNN